VLAFIVLLGMILVYHILPSANYDAEITPKSTVVAAVLAAGVSYHFRGRLLVVSDERPIPRCALHSAFPGSSLVILDSDRLSKHAGGYAVAITFRIESNGWRGGGVSLGAPGNRHNPRTVDHCLGSDRINISDNWCVLFPQDGAGDGGRDLGRGVMGQTAIRIEHLSKQYLIGGPQKAYDRLGYQVVDSLVAPFRKAGKLMRGQAGGGVRTGCRNWALKDISFEIKHGEVIGIIGRQWGWEEYLIKILSRITEPTEGYVDVYGRIGSLLEVGTGFHPELTGRENIYMNGAILGMTRKEIDRKFDEIVAFSEIGKFIDTVVKHYSSGMYVRLAFAVAAHLDPEILLVDEVLAVGDVSFQKKCLGKMGDVAKAGRTGIIRQPQYGCDSNTVQPGICLRSGEVVADGSITEVVQEYLRDLEQVKPKCRRPERS